MAEVIRTEEKVIEADEPVIFENNTDSDFSVSAAIVFRKSGLYNVSIVGRRTIISKVAERKSGHWIIDGHHIKCNQCGESMCNTDREGDAIPRNFCPNCGIDMIGEEYE